MSWPFSHEFNEAIQNPKVTFADPDLRGGEPVLSATGLPLPRSGNFADVYQMRGADGREWAVKCFTRPVRGLAERYARISEALERANLPFSIEFKFLPEGIRVGGGWHPVVKMEWVEGLLLNQVVREATNKPQTLIALGQVWAKLSQRLREAGVAHADIQHGNVLLAPGARAGAYGLKLIDYDGMWVPALASAPSAESGHPSFQHPARAATQTYSPDLDRFPLLVVATALRGLIVVGETLWDKYDNGDNLLFTESDFKHPKKSKLIRELWQTGDPGMHALVGRLAVACAAPFSQTPWLDEIAPGGEPIPLDRSAHQAATMALGISAPVPVRPPLPRPPVSAAEVKKTEPRAHPQPPARPEPKPLPVAPSRIAVAVSPVTKNRKPPERKPGEVLDLEIAPGVKMAFCWIPPGRAQLGAPAAEQQELAQVLWGGERQAWMNAEITTFRPNFITSGFWLGKYAVTQQEWASVTGENPSVFNGTNPNGAKGLGTARFPVENVNFHECQDFIRRLNERVVFAQKALGAPGRFAIPHENEWEYACRGGLGNERPFHFGAALNGEQANVDGTLAWGMPGKRGFKLGRTAPVGSYAKAHPHPWGLCDMHGNVSEWCENLYAAKEEAVRVARGGDWDSAPWQCRSANRLRADARIAGPGLRVCVRLGDL
ncbi:MAG TPA: SUMF1/EgtB/PvdO family nonheme iron enzyme [Gemmata sp.]